MARIPHADAAIDRMAATQQGVITRAQLLEAGMSRRSVDLRVSTGRLRPVFRGVYQVGPVEAPRARLTAAVLITGCGAAVSHRTAGADWGCVPPLPPGSPIDVIVPVRFRRRVGGIAVHRSRHLPPADITRRDGTPITTPLRTLLDLATVLPVAELERAIARAEREALVSARDLQQEARARRGHRGGRTIGRLLGEVVPSYTRSEAESRLLDLVRRGRLGQPRVNTLLHGYEVDFLWVRERLVVEVDGFAFHSSAGAFARDRRRDAALTAAGYRVIRVTWDDIVKRSEATLVMLAQSLVR